MAKQRAPESPWGLVLIGSILAGLGFVGADSGDLPALLALAWIGSVLAGVGVVGAGVTLGILRADWHRRK